MHEAGKAHSSRTWFHILNKELYFVLDVHWLGCLYTCCLWGHALKRSPGIIRKSRVLYPGPGFLSSATRPSLLKKHYNGLNQTKLYTRGPFYTIYDIDYCFWICLLVLLLSYAAFVLGLVLVNSFREHDV